MSDYRVKGVAPDMHEAAFLRVLREAKSPVSAGEARAVYSYCLARGLSVAFLLAMFVHESSAGKAGTATQTHSWGNTRRPSFGVPDIGEVPGRSGMFSKYANWADGGVSTIARFFDHKPYANAFTVREIIPIWAPSTDGNNVERYIAAVLADIARWATPVVQEPTPVSLKIREAIIPKGQPNRPGTKLEGGKPRGLTWHTTGNTNAGANAQAHVNFTHRDKGGKEAVSFHNVVDEDEAVQLLPYDEEGHHAGDGLGPGSGGSTTLGIELCVNSDGDWERTLRNGARLGARHMRDFGLGMDDHHQHNKWSGKDCPRELRKPGEWQRFLGMIAAEYAALTQPPAPPIASPFLRMWRHLWAA